MKIQDFINFGVFFFFKSTAVIKIILNDDPTSLDGDAEIARRIRIIVIGKNISMAHRAIVLQIEPLFQTRSVKKMIADGDFGADQIVVTDGADVLKLRALQIGGVAHGIDFDD